MRSLQATLLLAVAWVSFALSAALLGDASFEPESVVTHAKIAAVPVARMATSVEEALGGRTSRSTTHAPSIEASVDASVLVADATTRVRLQPTTAVVPVDPRSAPYDATAPPAPLSVA